MALGRRNTCHRCEDSTKEAASVALAAGAWTKMRGTGWRVEPSRKGPTRRLALISQWFSLNGDKSALMEANLVILGALGWREGFVYVPGGARVLENEAEWRVLDSMRQLSITLNGKKTHFTLRGSTCMTRLLHCSVLFNWAGEKGARFSVSLCPCTPISQKDTLAPFFFLFTGILAYYVFFPPFMPLQFLSLGFQSFVIGGLRSLNVIS